MPKVSIITPVYNATQRDFEFSKESLDAQTDKDFEWIVVDDGSTEYYNWSDVRLGNNYGASVARNVGFQISSGDIITYLDMGDELNKHRVRNLISMFEDSKSDLIFSAYDMVDENLHLVFDHFRYIGTEQFPTAFEYIQLLNTQNISIPMGVAHTRKPFVEVGGFQRGIVCGEDGILWRRMMNKIPLSKILFSDSRAGTYYISKTGQSRTQRRPEMGGFAFDGNKRDNGKYLDEQWFREYNSNGLYD